MRDHGRALEALVVELCFLEEHEGVSGVVLKASRTPGRVVRVVGDSCAATSSWSGFQAGSIMSDETCPRLVIDVRRGNTNINDVWTQDARVPGIHPERLIFDGCH